MARWCTPRSRRPRISTARRSRCSTCARSFRSTRRRSSRRSRRRRRSWWSTRRTARAPPEPRSQPSSPTAGSRTSTTDVTMPQMGVSVTEGTIVAWSREVGDTIEADETICEISTDKIDSDIPSPASGVLTEILVPVGETVEVGTVLARIQTGDADRAVTGTGEAAAALDPPSETAAPRPAGDGAAARHYSPVVQRIAAEHDVDLSSVQGSGRDGRVTKQDVLAVVAEQETATQEPPLHIESPYRPE